MPRFEKMSTKELIYGFQLKESLPIFDPKRSSMTILSFSCPDEHEKIKSYMQAFLQFLFDHFIVDLLRSNFYITEASNSRSRLVFYRHDVWIKLTAPVLENIQESMFQSIGSFVDKKKNVANARCRLVPKGESKFRPITAFKKTPTTVNSKA